MIGKCCGEKNYDLAIKVMLHGTILTTICNVTLLCKISIRVTWRLQTIFNATVVVATCCTTLNRLQILTCNVVAIN